MSYLQKYVGKFRVMADYDLSTGDFPKGEDGKLDPTFDDYYIKCKDDVQIRHAYDDVLTCLCFSKGKGLNVLRQIYRDKVGEDLPKKDDTLIKRLEQTDYIRNIEILDGDVMFLFHDSEMKYFKKLLSPQIKNSKIDPLSPENLPLKGSVKNAKQSICKPKNKRNNNRATVV
jgi:hypothetical protein